MIFLTIAGDLAEKKNARNLIESIRTFGGALGNSPIWLFESHPLKVPCQDMGCNGVQVFPLTVPKTVAGYDFAAKVFACAQAEKLAENKTQTLVWIDPCCLVIQPPLLFNLARKHSAAVRPVHIQNIGLQANEPLDGYWLKTYQALDLPDTSLIVESFVDQQRLRAYFNSHAFSIDPSKGILQRWFICYEKLVCDEEFQNGACRDERHKLFLFQAILSALLIATLKPDQILFLPPTYNYPYHLQQSVPLTRQLSVLNDLVIVVDEDLSLDPRKVKDIKINDPLKTWLLDHLD